MLAAPFDTPKMARKLDASGFAAPQAAGVAEAMAEAMSVADLATKADIGRLESEVTRVEKDLRTEIKSAESGLRHDIVLLRRDMEVMGRDLTIRPGGMMVAGFALVLGAMRYMVVHP